MNVDLARLNQHLHRLADSAWPAGATTADTEADRAAAAATLLDVPEEAALLRRRVTDRIYWLLALVLSRPGHEARPEVIRLVAATNLMHRANGLHAKGRLLDDTAIAPGGLAKVVLLGDCCMSGAFKLLVGLHSLPILAVFADSSVAMTEADVARLVGATTPLPPFDAQLRIVREGGAGLFIALARCMPLLGAAACSDPDAARLGEDLGIACALIESLAGPRPSGIDRECARCEIGSRLLAIRQHALAMPAVGREVLLALHQALFDACHSSIEPIPETATPAG